MIVLVSVRNILYKTRKYKNLFLLKVIEKNFLTPLINIT